MFVQRIALCMLLCMAMALAACGSKNYVQETEYTSEGQVTYKKTRVGDQVQSELQRVFEGTILEGYGIFESDNEGLARRTATQLAVAELAGQVQSLVQQNSVIYNNSDVRDVVENRVYALVNNYRIDQAGYDPGTNKYRVRVSIRGETLVREINKKYQ
jgi:hypothetical protein